jgi:hypothetical protein
VNFENAALEDQPSSEQKQRLEDWLSELRLICRKYGMLIDVDDSCETRIVDLRTDTVVGIGLVYLLDGDRITAMDCAGSILDGAWLVTSPDGLKEQRLLGTSWPKRP